MKQFVLAFLILIFSLINITAQDCITPPKWIVVKNTMPGFFKQHDLFFASENVGYTTGVRGTMRKTLDGGKTWRIIHGMEGMGTRAIMRTLYFVNELVGFAAGDGDYNPFQNIDNDAEFLRTYDGGLTWEKNFIDSIERVNDLKFFDAEHGLAVLFANDRTNPIGETFDGGKTWSFLETKIRSPEESKFILAGERVLVYGSDSLAWDNYILFEIKENGSIDYSLTSPPAKSTFYFYNENIGYATSADGTLKTTDGGITWEETNFPNTSTWSIVHFANENNGIVVNTIYEADTSGWEIWWYPVGLEIFATEDGGETWERYESGDLCVIEGRLSHSATNSEIHFHAGNYNGTYIFDPTGKEEMPIKETSIHPNPVGDYLHLNNLQKPNLQAEIYNLTGKKIYDAKATLRIKTDHLPNGYYILKLFNHDESMSYPFIKQ